MQEILNFLTENIIYFPLYYYFLTLIEFFLITGSIYFLLWHVLSKKIKYREIQKRKLFPGQIKYEVKTSIIAFFFMSLAQWPLFYLFTKGYTSIYLNWSQYPLWYVPMSLFIWMLWHDIYFFITHRWLHTPWAYKHIHYIHHKSHVPTPWSTHSFHWLEAIMQMLFLYPLVILMPMHLYSFLVFMGITHFFSVWGHFNYEMMSLHTWDAWWGKWVTTSTHHNLHHKYNKGNLGLYIRYWDILTKKIHPKTGERFKEYLKNLKIS